jgi:asparagine synthase (glutamine-hydrolysing)
MCGIAGVLHHRDSRERVDTAVLVRMRDALAHRGPDGAGLWVSPGGRAGLANRRLAIVDPGPAGGQPMANEDGSLWLTYNGEIYNQGALREELVRAGHRFRTGGCDTEVVVHAYEQWGAKCLERLEGMFAFALWDERRERLLLARDSVGVKPLYVCRRPGLLLFASEIKALLLHPAVAAGMEPAALYHYLTFLTAPAPLTLFRGIHKLPAGWALSVERDGQVAAWAYWDALPADGRYQRELDGLSGAVGEELCAQEVRRLLSESVHRHLMADVPLGVLLSGGIDSSVIAALASRHLGRPVDTFTVGFSDHPRLNELGPARRVARHLGTAHHEVLVGEEQMKAYLPELVYQQDEPIADWACIPLHFVSRLARDAGVKVVLVGEGSDEQFCGYDLYLRYVRALRRYWALLRRVPAPARRAVAGLARWAWRVTGRGGHYADALDRAAGGGELFWGGAVSLWELPKRQLVRRERMRHTGSPAGGLEAALPAPFLRPDSGAVVGHYMDAVDRAFPEADPLTRMAYLEFKLRLPELLLMRVDKITMGASVEARVPFLDRRLVEFTAGLPMTLKVRGDIPKRLLKRACEGILPPDVIHRPKVGFAAPMREWLRGDFGRHAEAAVLGSDLMREGYFVEERIRRLFRRHRTGTDVSLAIWTLYNLATWFDRWMGRSRPA